MGQLPFTSGKTLGRSSFTIMKCSWPFLRDYWLVVETVLYWVSSEFLTQMVSSQLVFNLLSSQECIHRLYHWEEWLPSLGWAGSGNVLHQHMKPGLLFDWWLLDLLLKQRWQSSHRLACLRYVINPPREEAFPSFLAKGWTSFPVKLNAFHFLFYWETGPGWNSYLVSLASSFFMATWGCPVANKKLVWPLCSMPSRISWMTIRSCNISHVVMLVALAFVPCWNRNFGRRRPFSLSSKCTFQQIVTLFSYFSLWMGL